MVDTKKVELFLEDRSGAELDDKCGQAYFWNRLFGGTGIVEKVESKHLSVGALIHEDLHFLAEMKDISESALGKVVDGIVDALSPEDKQNDSQMATLYRRLGWFIAWGLFYEPTVREKYDTISTEGELVLDRDPLWVSITPDRVVRAKSDRHIEYWEYKSTISASTKWMMSWMYKIQLHLGIKVISEELEEEVKFAQVIGLMKGSEDWQGNLRHPYVSAWRNLETGAWTHDYTKSRGAAWTKAFVWDYPDGILAWVKKCGQEVAHDQFPMSPPVMLNEPMLDEWILRRTFRQRRVHSNAHLSDGPLGVKMHVLTFEKRQNQCRPPFGDACPYVQACWNAEVGKDPIGSGNYVVRKPHHNLEIIGVEL